MGQSKHSTWWQSEYWLVFLIWGTYAAIQLFLFPLFAPRNWSVDVDTQSFFFVLYTASVAFLIAFPFTDFFLTKQRYITFTGAALGVVAIASLLHEFVIDPFLFGSRIIAAATYLTAIEVAGVTLLLLAARLILNRRQNEQRLVRLQKANVEAELQNLKGQINPHFLFNALNNIYSHALHHSDKTPGLILKLSDMLRYTTYNCNDETVLLEEEIDFLTDYLEIQRMALDGRGTSRFCVDGEARGKKIPPLLLIPFVENCFKHSLDTMDQGIDIKIRLEVLDDKLHFNCSNTFETKTEEVRSDQSFGVGEANVQRRLRLLYHDNFLLKKSVVQGRYDVTLEVPVQS